MATVADKEFFAHRLVADLPGLDFGVAMAWANAENGVYPGNILGVTSSSAKTANNPHGLVSYPSVAAGADATAALIKSNYPDIVASLDKGPQAQAQAIINSRWNTGIAYNPATGTGGSSYYARTGLGNIAGVNRPSGSGGATGSSSSSSSSSNPVTKITSSVASFLGLTGTDASQPLTDALAQQVAHKYADINGGDARSKEGAYNNIYNLLKNWIGVPVNQVPFNVDSSGHNTGQIVVPTPDQQASGDTQRGDLLSFVPDITSAVTFVGVILVGLVFIGAGAIITLKRREA